VTIGQWGQLPSNGHILLSGASPLANNGIGEWTGTDRGRSLQEYFSIGASMKGLVCDEYTFVPQYVHGTVPQSTLSFFFVIQPKFHSHLTQFCLYNQESQRNAAHTAPHPPGL
jgi:hypothetical protein